MRRLIILPSLLFGLIFAGGGLFMLSETAVPMWQNWQRMQNWQPTGARLISISSADNETRARYSYEYGGESYRGDRVGVNEFNDNIGSYHQDLQAYLGQIQRSGKAFSIWVNPFNPSEAVIDRKMRWGLFVLISGFCSVFILIGSAVVYAGVRGSSKITDRRRPSLRQIREHWQQAQKNGTTALQFAEFCRQRDPESAGHRAAKTTPTDWQNRKGWENAEIKSEAVKGVLLFWGFAIFWNAITTPLLFTLPKELHQQNYAALFALLFPIAGLFLIYKAIKRSLEYQRYGRVIFTMDPYPGAIGGHVGGRIQVKNLPYQATSDAQSISIKLECVHSYVSGSGDNRSRRESIVWAEQGRPKIERAMEGVNLTFRFDVPDRLPQADVEKSDAYHFWRLSIMAAVPGIDLNRSYNIPVFATGETSRSSSHDISAQAAAVRKQQAEAAGHAIASGQFDIEGLSRAMRLRDEGNQIHLKFPMFRNKFLTVFAAIFAGGFGFASFSMFEMASGGGLFGIFIAVFGIPFFLVALVATIVTIYLPFNNLQVIIGSSEVAILRRLLLIPIYRRRLPRDEISYLGSKRSGSTGQGVDKIEHFKIFAQDKQGRKITLAEDIDGEDVAAHFRDYLAQRIGVTTQ